MPRPNARLIVATATWRGAAVRLLTFAVLVSVLGALNGCGSFRSIKVDHPVVGPAPPRVSQEDLKYDTRNYANLNPDPTPGQADVKLVKFDDKSQMGPAAAPLEDSQIVATVNGQPIMASEVIERYAPKLAMVKARQPAQFNEIRNHLLKQDLDNHIERVLLSQSLLVTLKQDQIDGIEQQLDEEFENQVQDMIKKAGVAGPEELEHILRQQGTSLSSLRRAFGSQQLAFQYLAMNAREPKVYSRSELLEYYNAHLDEYRYPAQVDWREIIVFHDMHGGRAQAAERVKEAIRELKSGKSFEEVAKTYSNGVHASKGGAWGWTQFDSIAGDSLKAALMNTPKGEISEVLINEKSFQIVQVVDRKSAGVTPFEEVQNKIEKHLGDEFRREMTDQVLSKLRKEAIIETIFDNDPDWIQMQQDAQSGGRGKNKMQ